jgi:antitoxin component YwqK of YwqJK toxin-antitoxin module
MIRFVFLFAIVLCIFSTKTSAQILDIEEEDTTATSGVELTTDVLPSIELNTKAKKQEKGKKGLLAEMGIMKNKSQVSKQKQPKNEYYGVKTSRSFIKHLRGENIMIERFQYINEYKAPPPHNEEMYYLNKKKREITKSNKFDKENGALLHGYYRKTWNGETLEEGYFYFGVKHGRWEIFDRDTNLVAKYYYDKGLYEDTQITYYDAGKTKVKEIIPLHNGVRHGTYKAFYESGRPKERGEYIDGEKVGKWYEYYDQTKYARKREIVYSNRPFDEKFQSYITKEWDDKGKLIVNQVK